MTADKLQMRIFFYNLFSDIYITILNVVPARMEEHRNIMFHREFIHRLYAFVRKVELLVARE